MAVQLGVVGGTWYQRNRERARATGAAYRAANPEKRAASSARHYVRNREKRRAQISANYIRNKEQRGAYSALHYARNKDKKCQQHVAWCASNRERMNALIDKWRKKNPETCRAMYKQWCQAHPDAIRAYSATRRALKRKAPGRGVTPEQTREILAGTLGLCSYCNERTKLTLDHIEPLAKGGAHDVDNLAAVCLTCNSSKHDTPLLVWLARRALNKQTQEAA